MPQLIKLRELTSDRQSSLQCGWTSWKVKMLELLTPTENQVDISKL
jgi:hypothetical protein